MTYVFSTKYAGQICTYTLFTQLIMNQYIFIHIQLFSEGFHHLSLEPITQIINPSFKPEKNHAQMLEHNKNLIRELCIKVVGHKSGGSM